MAVKVHNLFETGQRDLIQLVLAIPSGLARPRRKNMTAIAQRRAIGLLVVFATVLTVIASWNLPEHSKAENARLGAE